MEVLTILGQQRLFSHLCYSVLSRSATDSSGLEDVMVPIQENSMMITEDVIVSVH